jgi:hypothetical protein
MAQCDGQHLDPLPSAARATAKAAGPANDSPDANGGRAVNEVPDANGGRAVSERPSANGGRAVSEIPNANHGSDARVSAREPTGRNAVRRSAHVGVRAKQTIAPATRRAVRIRDQRRCVVPGCRNARFLDLHHIGLRSEGGGNEADNLVTLCGLHHRAVHRGTLSVSGRMRPPVISVSEAN